MKHATLSTVAVLTLALAFTVPGDLAAAQKFTIDSAHTNLTFSVKHMVISNIKGRFKEFTGTITLDGDDLTRMTASGSIKVASIDTDNEKRDEHLRSPDFFDAAKYPEITFKSKRVEKRKDGYVMIGDFTMHGVTKEIEIPFEFAGKVKDPMMNADRIGLEARLTINRQDFGVTWNKTLDRGQLLVGNEVKIELNVEAVEMKK